MWLGATYTVKEGTWIWESSKTKMTYSQWGGGEPDKCCGGDNNCLFMWNTSGKWNDWACKYAGLVLSTICELVFPC